MDKLLRPETFNTDPSSPTANKEWSHWKTKFQKFTASITDVTEANKHDLLINFVGTEVYAHISDSTDYNASITALDNVFNPKKNVIFARHLLNTCKQEPEQSIDVYFQKLIYLATDCDFKSVDAASHQNQAIRESFISGLRSSDIRQRLLESERTDLADIHSLARGLEVAKVQAQSYNHSQSLNAVVKESFSLEELFMLMTIKIITLLQPLLLVLGSLAGSVVVLNRMLAGKHVLRSILPAPSVVF